MKKTAINKIIKPVILSVIIAVTLQFTLSFMLSQFEGTDDQAVGIIQNIVPGYRQWAEHLWEPSSDLQETIMFALQAAIGVSIIVGYFAHKKNNAAS